jgi:hypothetical protein
MRAREYRSWTRGAQLPVQKSPRDLDIGRRAIRMNQSSESSLIPSQDLESQIDCLSMTFSFRILKIKDKAIVIVKRMIVLSLQ